MSPLDEIDAPWRDAMENAGLYSIRDLAAKAQIGPSTVSDLISGRKASSERTMQAVADSLRLPVTTIRDWAAAKRGEVGPYAPPAVANRLTERQRRALDELIRAIVTPPDEPDTEQPEFEVSRVEGLRLAPGENNNHDTRTR